MRLSCGLPLNVELFSCLIVFHVDPATRPRIQVQPSPKDTLMHEVTHIVASTDDLISYLRSPIGFRNSGEDLRKRYEKISEANSWRGG